MNFDDLIYKIKDSNPIESVIGEYVQLKKSGVNYKGLCPFHNEKTPSFFVSSEKGFYHCFGCKKSGDVIKFIEEIEHVSFNEAIEILAKRSGIDISEYKRDFSKNSIHSRILNANKIAMEHFIRRLQYNKDIYNYLTNRNLSDTNIREFKLGYCDREYSLLKLIKEKNLKMQDFIDAGLIVKNKKGEYYDRFYGRIMFPIINYLGNVIGFGGRIVNKDGPKYINSSENPVFKKGNFLYGLNLSKKSIYNNKYAILVEGYMDFISLYKTGITNAVAQLGTACTDNQARLLRKISEKIIIMYDSDNAGIEASIRSIPILLKENIKVDVFINKDFKDPDELVNNIESMDNKYIENNAMGFIDFIDEYYKRDENDNIIRRKHIIKYIVDAINLISDDILRNLYIKEAEYKLDINESLFSHKSYINKRVDKKQETIKKNDIFMETIAMMLSNNNYTEILCEELDENEFQNNISKGLFINICNMWHEENNINIDKILNKINIINLKTFFNERIIKYSEQEFNNKKVQTLIKMIKTENLKKKIKNNEIKIKNTKDEEERERLQQINIILKQKLKKGV